MAGIVVVLVLTWFWCLWLRGRVLELMEEVLLLEERVLLLEAENWGGQFMANVGWLDRHLILGASWRSEN